MFTYFACNFLILYIVIYKQVCYNKTIINKGVFNMQVTNRVKLLLSTNIRCCPKPFAALNAMLPSLIMISN